MMEVDSQMLNVLTFNIRSYTESSDEREKNGVSLSYPKSIFEG